MWARSALWGMDVIHTAVWVTDLERTREFYVDALGLEETLTHVSDDGTENVYVAGEGSDAEIQFRHDPGTNDEIDPAGIDHLEFSVEDAGEAFDRAVEAGAGVVKEPFTAEGDEGRFRVAYVEDPDGYRVVFQETVEAYQ